MSNKKKIELYLDGPTFQEIKDFKNIDGYTFNPSLYKKLKAENYIEFTKNRRGDVGDKIFFSLFRQDHVEYSFEEIGEILTEWGRHGSGRAHTLGKRSHGLQEGF